MPFLSQPLSIVSMLGPASMWCFGDVKNYENRLVCVQAQESGHCACMRLGSRSFYRPADTSRAIEAFAQRLFSTVHGGFRPRNQDLVRACAWGAEVSIAPPTRPELSRLSRNDFSQLSMAVLGEIGRR
ncbi:hypothetical protein Bbelb_373100 [Branchiostoma belcheri]|nr:hypothetical protein Bbelb_373100 [Branchiostoma belcheri]